MGGSPAAVPLPKKKQKRKKKSTDYPQEAQQTACRKQTRKKTREEIKKIEDERFMPEKGHPRGRVYIKGRPGGDKRGSERKNFWNSRHKPANVHDSEKGKKKKTNAFS